MANPAFSLVPGTFFPALFDFASSIDSPPIQAILDALCCTIPVVVFALFVYAVCYVCLYDVVDDSGPQFDDLEAGRLPLLGRRHGGPARPCRDPPPKSEALMRVDVYRSDGGENKRTDCGVCLEDFRDGDACLWLTCCGHAYHRACVNLWLLDHRRCPICHATVRVAPAIRPDSRLE
ncbi:E3 ubiquitin-protein ligase Os04g0590900-like [Syzygium oleosum]|uniref:E3 ubiquitin-protein ligase Os04g0590900-like n=1 Tax=Syzygium oleosum TaxID=219896 RepID=UPI0024B9B4B1|nr:E3 ubiquitin-protein ligase Os04g0590900-like [Syzygium oleosum]